jgi:hypothetical protein
MRIYNQTKAKIFILGSGLAMELEAEGLRKGKVFPFRKGFPHLMLRRARDLDVEAYCRGCSVNYRSTVTITKALCLQGFCLLHRTLEKNS